jgi:hypothetical protein
MRELLRGMLPEENVRCNIRQGNKFGDRCK